MPSPDSFSSCGVVAIALNRSCVPRRTQAPESDPFTVQSILRSSFTCKLLMEIARQINTCPIEKCGGHVAETRLSRAWHVLLLI